MKDYNLYWLNFLFPNNGKRQILSLLEYFQYPVYEMDVCRQIMSTLKEFFLFNRLT